MDPRLQQMTVALGKMIHGYQALGLFAAAAELDLWTPLRTGPKTAFELAQAAQCSEAHLRRVLRGLVMVSALRKEARSETASEAGSGEVVYRMTTLGRLASEPHLPFADQIQLAAREYAPAWLQIGSALRANAIPFDRAFGRSVWQHRQEEKAVGEAFDRVMARVQTTNRAFILEQCELSSAKILVDVGGGAGRLCAALVQKYPHLRGVVFDQPHLQAEVEATLKEARVDDRCSFSGGDFFESVPAGDALLLQHILHDWTDEECCRILSHCRAAMDVGSRLFVFERLVGLSPAGQSTEPEASDVLRDLHMLCITGGQERSEEEYVALLSRCGFEKVRSQGSGTGVDLLEARAT